jgi:hypothetical protein
LLDVVRNFDSGKHMTFIAQRFLTWLPAHLAVGGIAVLALVHQSWFSTPFLALPTPHNHSLLLGRIRITAMKA